MPLIPRSAINNMVLTANQLMTLANNIKVQNNIVITLSSNINAAM